MKSPQNQSEADRRFMRRALRLARKGLGRSSPNPAVGAVVVKKGRIVGQGYHAKAGGPHAEIHALKEARDIAKGATLYVTLEPCHHTGRTPPCTQAIIQAGLKRVVFGARDPNPKVKGGGGAYLRRRGLEVVSGVLESECLEEHRFFLTHVTKGRPHVLLKTAATMDGKTAAASGDSRWVTAEKSRAFAHRLRSWLDAICVGIGTVRRDDPSLTCRVRGGRDPVRLVVDTRLRLAPAAKVLDQTTGAPCIVACGPHPAKARRKALEQAGAQILSLPADEGGVDLEAMLAELGRMGIISLLLEGGAGLAWGFVSKGLVDELMYFFAPKLIGGAQAPISLGAKKY
ncbi:MAG: bifunctional diaminohydroxyphosphoribosylaminopyrimidine deaminase/5-amino-6-(5-phosphoribosylamino)uracil reductase RibD, partial [Desulfarculaceae bacterium]